MRKRRVITSINDLPLVMDNDDVADVLNITSDSALDLMRAEDFPRLAVGKLCRVYRDDFISWLKPHRPDDVPPT